MISTQQQLSQSFKHTKSKLQSPLGISCSTLGHWLLALFAPSGGPQITKTLRSGQIYWNVYAPYTEKTIPFSSENDFHVWLDQQRYRQ